MSIQKKLKLINAFSLENVARVSEAVKSINQLCKDEKMANEITHILNKYNQLHLVLEEVIANFTDCPQSKQALSKVRLDLCEIRIELIPAKCDLDLNEEARTAIDDLMFPFERVINGIKSVIIEFKNRQTMEFYKKKISEYRVRISKENLSPTRIAYLNKKANSLEKEIIADFKDSVDTSFAF
jgi:hypothetical protein